MKKRDHTVLSFLKFGKTEHILDLYENGNLYLNSVEYYRNLEDGNLRGDMYEGVHKIHNSRKGIFEIKSLNYKGTYESLQFRQSYEQVLGNIYSLYCVSSAHIKNPLKFRPNPKVLEFGSSCLMIYKNEIFLDRIRKALRETGFGFVIGFVKYYNVNKRNGEVSLFEKPLQFRYQNEFRIYVQRRSVEPLILNIGPLKDIAEIYDSKTIVETLSLVDNLA